ncbi:MAG: ion transporter [Flavobacteriales bacterium]|nr:ion transporter [Flavobacteriales bacterium]
MANAAPPNDLKRSLRRVIFGTDTRAGRLFDVVLLWLILISVVLVLLESVKEVRAEYGRWLRIAEWVITILFTVEYALRVWISTDRRKYVTSGYGLVDLAAVLPTWLSLFLPGVQALAIVRSLRLLRVFRVFNLFNYVREARLLLLALLASRHRILVFMLAVLALVSVFGTIMYLVESPEAGFTSIPRSIYWAIVTLTTVGYGDIAPVTALGQALASAIMILGYAIIAIPTGIVSVELARQSRNMRHTVCEQCGNTEHPDGARHCHRCGAMLPGMQRDREV